MKNAIVLLMFVLVSCKKGPLDPLVSLKSRKERLCKSWILSSSESTRLETSRNGAFVNVRHARESADKDSLACISIYMGDTLILRHGYRSEISFFKDHTVLTETRITKSYNDTIIKGFDPETFKDYKYSVVYDSVFVQNIYATWSFVDRDKDHKKKERIFITTNRFTQTVNATVRYYPLSDAPALKEDLYQNSEDLRSQASVKMYDIYGLSSEKLVLTSNIDSSYSYYLNNTFPVAVRVTGEEKAEYILK